MKVVVPATLAVAINTDREAPIFGMAAHDLEAKLFTAGPERVAAW